MIGIDITGLLTPEFAKAAQDVSMARSMCDEVYGYKKYRLKVPETLKELSAQKTDGCTKAVLAEINSGTSAEDAKKLLSGTAGKEFLIAGAVAGIALVGLGWWLGGRR